MRMVKKQSGFAILELIVILAIIAVIALLAVRINDNRNKTVSNQSAKTSSSNQTLIKGNVSPAPTVESSADLDKADQTLDQNDPSTANVTDSSQIDQDLSSF